MYLSITELHEEIENQILICDDAEDEHVLLYKINVKTKQNVLRKR